MKEIVSYEKDRGIAIVYIDNPPVNVIGENVVIGLNQVFDRLAEDDEVRAIVLSGKGDKAFVAGGNIKEFPKLVGQGVAFNEARARDMQEPFNKIDNIAKPVIAAIDGLALGGGCELALCCDIRIAEEHSIIGLPEVKLGLFPGAGGTQRLPRLIGEGRAKELILTGRAVTAEEAERIGLVNKVVPTGKGLAAAIELAEEIAGYSFQAVSRIKKTIDEGMKTTLEEGLLIEAKYFGEVFQTEDVKTGVQAFIEKKQPVFIHK